MESTKNISELTTKIVSQRSTDVEVQLSNTLKWCCEYLDLEIGIISHIEKDKQLYSIQEFYPSDSGLYTGQLFDLDSTYCSISIKSDDVLAIENMGKSQYSEHKCYSEFKLESYIGICFEVEGSFYGTINFSSSTPRNSPFTQEEKQLLRFVGGWVSGILYRKYIEQQLKEEHKLYKLISSNIAEMVCMHKPDGTYTYVSESVENLLGYTPDELIGTSPYLLFHQEDLERIASGSHARSAGGENDPGIQYRIRKKDGSYVWFDTATQPVLNEEGEVIHLQTTSREISDKKRQEILFQRSQEIANVGGWELNLVTNELFWTEQVYRIHQLPLDSEVKVDEAINFYPEGEPRETITALINTAIQTGENWDIELPIITAKGNMRWVQAIGEVEFAEGAPVKLRGTFQDITEQRREQELYIKSQNMAGVGGWELDLITNQNFWSDEVYKIYGIPVGSDLTNLDGLQNFPEGGPRELLQNALDELIETGTPYDIQTEFVTNTGKRLWVRSMGEAEFIDGKPVRLRGTFQDITQQKQHEDQIKDQVQQLTNLKETKEKLYSVLAHDLRNSIYGISGLLSFVAADMNKGEYEIDDVITKINLVTNSADQSYKLLNNMLTWIKLQSGSMQIEKHSFDVFESIQTTIDLLKPSLDTKNISINLNTPESCTLFGEEESITTVFRNILNNAIKFSNPGSNIDICYSADEHQNRARIVVRDYGVGMNNNTVSNLFDVFNRNIQRGTADEKGTGLGLILSKDLIDLNCGTIHVESAPGEGSTFTLTFPLHSEILQKTA